MEPRNGPQSTEPTSKHARTRARFPLPDAELADLFATVEREGGLTHCDHTLRRCLAWLEAKGLEPGPVISWLQETGGYCDCEVLLNSLHTWSCARLRG